MEAGAAKGEPMFWFPFCLGFVCFVFIHALSSFVYFTKSTTVTLIASANFRIVLRRGSLVLVRNCHADFRAESPVYPMRCPSSSSVKPDLLKRSRNLSIVFSDFEGMMQSIMK